MVASGMAWAPCSQSRNVPQQSCQRKPAEVGAHRRFPRTQNASRLTAAVLGAFLLYVPADASLAEVAAKSYAKRRAAGGLTLAAGRSGQNSQFSSASGNLLRQLIERSAETAMAAPLANDTVSAAYWAKIDSAIAQAAATTIPPASDVLTTAEPSAWAKVFQASQPGGTVSAEDLTPEEAATRAAQETPSGFVPGQQMSGNIPQQQSLVPYDMQLGARILQGLTPQSPPTPPPLQAVVTAQFVAQCPLVMFAQTLLIGAPKCGSDMGTWQDPASKRAVLRWKPGTSGLHFGLDSAVYGLGSATFADLSQEISMSGIFFALSNCLGVKRYTIQQEVVQYDAIGAGVISSAQEHDVSRTGMAWFYKYKIIAPNGTLVAQSNLFRQGQSSVNITEYVDEITTGRVIARASRVGNWKGSEWNQCSVSQRAWKVDFLVSSRDMENVATVMDLRVAATALLTLMAFRDEASSPVNGQNRTGEFDMMKNMIGSFFLVVLVIAMFGAMVMVIRRFGFDGRMRRCCFKVEQVCLPKRPAWKRNPPFNPTY